MTKSQNLLRTSTKTIKITAAIGNENTMVVVDEEYGKVSANSGIMCVP
jgi:hypothetical protein